MLFVHESRGYLLGQIIRDPVESVCVVEMEPDEKFGLH